MARLILNYNTGQYVGIILSLNWEYSNNAWNLNMLGIRYYVILSRNVYCNIFNEWSRWPASYFQNGSIHNHGTGYCYCYCDVIRWCCGYRSGWQKAGTRGNWMIWRCPPQGHAGNEPPRAGTRGNWMISRCPPQGHAGNEDMQGTATAFL